MEGHPAKAAPTEREAHGPETPGVRLGLVDLIYGAAVAYAFEKVGEVADWSAALRWGLAYLVLGVDWVYLHARLKESSRFRAGYESNRSGYFLFEMAIVLCIARLFDVPEAYWGWFAAVFWLYVAWDLWVEPQLDDRRTYWTSIIGDGIAALGFTVYAVCVARGRIEPSLRSDVIGAIVYAGAVWAWHGFSLEWVAGRSHAGRP